MQVMKYNEKWEEEEEGEEKEEEEEAEEPVVYEEIPLAIYEDTQLAADTVRVMGVDKRNIEMDYGKLRLLDTHQKEELVRVSGKYPGGHVSMIT